MIGFNFEFIASTQTNFVLFILCENFHLLKVFDVFFWNDFAEGEDDHDDGSNHHEKHEKHVFHTEFHAMIVKVENGDQRQN